ncbi:MAG: response regulator, partial [Desulfobacteraceae bacterium]
KKPFDSSELIKSVHDFLIRKEIMEKHRLASAKLAATRKQYQYMVDHSVDLISILNQHHCFTYINPQFEHLLGVDNSELIGQPFSKILHPDDIQKVSQLYELSHAVPASDTEFNIRLRLKKINKQSVQDWFDAYAVVELRAVAMYLPDLQQKERFAGIYCTAKDITLQVTMEDQLRQSQKMEAIGTLAGGIAHDFNNILMGIQGYSSLLKTGLDPDSKEFQRINRIEDYIQSGAQLAGQLLGFAQKGLNETELINLNHLLALSAEMFGRTKKDILIRQSLAPDLWQTRVNEGQMKQVLMNLFVNAWQAMPDGGTIHIRSENVRVDLDQLESLSLINEGNYVKVTVTDTGVGIDTDIIDQIFEPFFTTKARDRGTGLGLATAYGIIKGHNGSFQVVSTPGSGSSFFFYLPGENGSTGHPAAEPVPHDHECIISGKGSILLVDDEPGVIDVCSEMLTTLGYQVMAVNSGPKALQAIRSEVQCFDLIILDLVMPGMDGRQTFERIKQLRPSAKVLICSGYNKREEIEAMVANGCDDYLLKPFDMVVLSEKLQSVFKDASQLN